MDSDIFDTYAANSAAFAAETPASEGVAGLAGNYQLDEHGWEGDQQYAKNANWCIVFVTSKL